MARNGSEVWAIPGSKVEFLLQQFPVKPGSLPPGRTPLALPITAQQAVFLPALFAVENARQAEVATLNDTVCRVITASLMPDVAKNVRAEDLQIGLWVAAGYLPKRVEIFRQDFTAVVDITALEFVQAWPLETWQPPVGSADVYRTDANYLEQLIYVIMNSLKNPASRPAEPALTSPY